MKTAALPLAAFLFLCPSLAQAQVHLHIDIGLPIAPPLVEVEPGIQVVEGFREEVFFHDGWYWCRRPDGWYRAHSPRGRFGRMDYRRVPRILMREPIGHYRNWHHDRPDDRGPGREQERPWDDGRGPGHHRQNSHHRKGWQPLPPPRHP
jgi:hypothetical protein